MKKFSRSFNGYNVHEVNSFLDNIIRRVDLIIKEEERIKNEVIEKDNKIKELEKEIEHYKSNEIINSLEEVENIKTLAKNERDAIINDARKNANRIISDALVRAEKTEYQAEVLKKNVSLFKKRVRNILNEQLDLIEDLDSEELN